MYRFSFMFDNNKGAIQQLVSDQLADMILFVFGPLDDKNNFTDCNRSFMFSVFTDFYSYIYNAQFPTYLFPAATWDEYIRMRFADMYRKLIDRNTIYGFNELGEGFLALLLELMSSTKYYQYFCKFPDNKNRIKKQRNSSRLKYIPLIERGKNKNLDEEILLYAEKNNMWKYYPRTDAIYEDYSKYYKKVIRYMLSDPASYISCERTEAFSEKLGKKYYDGDTFYMDSLINFLFWDEDYYQVFRRLADVSELDRFLSTVGVRFDFIAQSAFSLFSFNNDIICNE